MEKYALAGRHMLKNLFTISCPVINTQFKQTTEEIRWAKRILICSCVPEGQHTFKETVHSKTNFSPSNNFRKQTTFMGYSHIKKKTMQGIKTPFILMARKIAYGTLFKCSLFEIHIWKKKWCGLKLNEDKWLKFSLVEIPHKKHSKRFLFSLLSFSLLSNTKSKNQTWFSLSISSDMALGIRTIPGLEYCRAKVMYSQNRLSDNLKSNVNLPIWMTE